MQFPQPDHDRHTDERKISMDQFHRLLQRQLKRSFNGEPEELEGGILPSSNRFDIGKLAKLISDAYEDYDKTRAMNDRATQLMSEELMELNHKISEESRIKLQESERRFRLAVEGTKDGIWEWDLKGNEIWHSARCYEMLGYHTEDLSDTWEVWNNLVYIDDRELLNSCLEAHLKENIPYNLTARFRHKDGSLRYFLCRAASIRNEIGEPIRIVGTFTDLTEMMQMQRDLREAVIRAEKANKAKSEFLANISHEMRTPLHGILSYSKMGAEKVAKAPKEKILHYFNSIKSSGDILLKLLNDLLDLAKMESGKMDYQFSKWSLASTVNEVATEFELIVAEKKLSLEINIPYISTETEFDKNRIMQVIRNLLFNAIKFSPNKGRIAISLTEIMIYDKISGVEVPHMSLAVVDSGIGIPEGEFESIFDKFVQSSKTSDGSGGTGLGLSISREIIEAHNGLIWAENNKEGGAKFTFIMPKKHI